MNAFATLFSGPLAQAIGWALLHLLWQGVLVAAILAATLALLRNQSANARYLASCGALIVILALGVVTAYRAYQPMTEITPATVADVIAADETAQALSESIVIMPPPPVDGLAVVATFATAHMPQIVLVWLIGVTLLSTRLILGWIGAHRLAVRRSQPAEPQWERSLAVIAEALGLRRTIRLLESAAVEVPTVIGWIRPVVLLPVATLSGLSAEQIEMILAHEVAHIRRHDFIINLLQSTVETLLFYQPAVWWISRRIRVEREHCCDDLAVAVFGDPIRYARALTRFEELRLDAAQAVVAANGGSLLTRIRRLVCSSGESANWSSRWAAGAALLVVVVALLVTPALPVFAKHEQQPTPAPAPTPAVAPHSSVDVTPEPPGKPECDTNAADEMNGDDASDDVSVDDEVDVPEPAEAPTPMVAIRPGRAPRVRLAPVAFPNIHAMVAPAIEHSAEIAAEAMASMFADMPEIDRKIAENGKLSVDDLIQLRNSGVTPQYIEEMRGIGLGTLSLNDLMAMRIQGVTPEYVRKLRAAGVDVTSVKSVIALRIQGVTADYIEGMRAAGYAKLSTQDLIGMRVQGVSPKYVHDLADAGYKNLTPSELISLRVQGVNASFVKALADAGYANLSVRDLVRLAASGVNAEFIRDLSKYRTK